MERSPGEGKGYPLQCSGLENSMDCIVLRIAKSWTQLSDLHFHHVMDKSITLFLGHLGLSTHTFWSKTFSKINFFFFLKLGHTWCQLPQIVLHWVQSHLWKIKKQYWAKRKVAMGYSLSRKSQLTSLMLDRLPQLSPYRVGVLGPHTCDFMWATLGGGKGPGNPDSFQMNQFLKGLTAEGCLPLGFLGTK